MTGVELSIVPLGKPIAFFHFQALRRGIKPLNTRRTCSRCDFRKFLLGIGLSSPIALFDGFNSLAFLFHFGATKSFPL